MKPRTAQRISAVQDKRRRLAAGAQPPPRRRAAVAPSAVFNSITQTRAVLLCFALYVNIVVQTIYMHLEYKTPQSAPAASSPDLTIHHVEIKQTIIVISTLT